MLWSPLPLLSLALSLSSFTHPSLLHPLSHSLPGIATSLFSSCQRSDRSLASLILEQLQTTSGAWKPLVGAFSWKLGRLEYFRAHRHSCDRRSAAIFHDQSNRNLRGIPREPALRTHSRVSVDLLTLFRLLLPERPCAHRVTLPPSCRLHRHQRFPTSRPRS